MIKRFRMFAGPNGSGKSSLINQIKRDFNIGCFVNADVIESSLNSNRMIDCEDYIPKVVTQDDWDYFIDNYNHQDIRFVNNGFPRIRINENIIVADSKINSYHAALLCEFFRGILLNGDFNFSFETVMSHTSKIDLLKEAKKKNFKTYLYYVCTQDPEINVYRVKNRAYRGEHNVPEEKIIKRYYKSLDLLVDAFKIVDRAFILDSSNKNRDVILEKDGNQIFVRNQLVPEWVEEYLIKKLMLKES